jgi:hypothetical protein
VPRNPIVDVHIIRLPEKSVSCHERSSFLPPGPLDLRLTDISLTYRLDGLSER